MTLRHLITLAIISLLNSTLYSQNPEWKYNIKGSPNWDLRAFVDDTQNVVTSYRTVVDEASQSYKTHLLFYGEKGFKDVALRGDLVFDHCSYSDSSFTFIYRNKHSLKYNSSVYQIIEFDKNGNNIIGSSKIDFQNETLILSYVHESKCHYISAIKKQNIIRLRVVNSSKSVEIKDVPVDKKIVKKLAKINYQYIHNEFELSPEQVLNTHKAFIYDNRLLFFNLLIDENANHVIEMEEIDFDNRSHNHRQIEKSFPRGNYFPFEDRIFYLNISGEELNMLVYSLKSLEVIKKYSYENDSLPDEFLSSKVYKMIGGTAETLELKKNQTRLESLSVGSEFINVVKSGNRVKVFFGSAYYPSSGGTMVGGGGSFSTPMGSVQSMPTGFNYSYGGSGAVFVFGYGYMTYPQLVFDSYKTDEPIGLVTEINDMVDEKRKLDKKSVSSYTSVINGKNAFILVYSNKEKTISLLKL